MNYIKRELREWALVIIGMGVYLAAEPVLNSVFGF